MNKIKTLFPVKFLFLFAILICCFGFYKTELLAQDHTHKDNVEVVQHENEHSSEQDHAEGHGSNMSPLFFVIIALIIGAATRQGLRKSPLPFTVSLLIIGLGLGAATRVGLVWDVENRFSAY